MSKRYTATDKWKKKWYRELGSRLRDLRQYLLDSCDHAGIWEVDLATASYFIGEPVTLDDIAQALRNRHTYFDDKIFIPDFIEFQYGELKEDSRPHQSVIKVLKKYALFEGYLKGIYTLKDKAKDKEQDKDKDKDKDPREKIETGSLDSLFTGEPGERTFRSLSPNTKQVWLSLYGGDTAFIKAAFLNALVKWQKKLPGDQRDPDTFFTNQLKYDWPHHEKRKAQTADKLASDSGPSAFMSGVKEEMGA